MRIQIAVSDGEVLNAVYEAIRIGLSHSSDGLNSTQVAILEQVRFTECLRLRTEDVPTVARALVSQCSDPSPNKLQLIRMLRGETGCGLKEAKDAIEAAMFAKGC